MYRFALALLMLGPLLSQTPQRGVKTNEPIAVQRKLALVIGNAKYVESPLRNSSNDAKAMAQTLRDLKFDDIAERHDLTIEQMNREIDAFELKLRPGDLALFYFAGHGVQAREQNYLIPVDFTGGEADLPYKAYPAALVRDKLDDSGARLRVLILDSCRNNPFRRMRGDTPGLAPMGSPVEGTFIAYATADNGVADDGPAANGLFTRALLGELKTPGLDLKQVFERTKEAVYQDSGKKQRPFTYDGVIGQFYFLGPVTIVNNPTATDLSGQIELGFWNGLDKGDAESLRMYLAKYPEGQFAGLARRNLERIGGAGVAPAPPSPVTSNAGATHKAGETKTGKDGLTYVWIPPGTFQMGCSPGDVECYPDEKPAHAVTISKGLWMGQTPVTQAAYQRAEGSNPSRFAGDDSLPVEDITWYKAEAYCGRLGMRLPTEAEWEYAARAGDTAARYGGLDAIAWYGDNSGDKTHPVGQKQANAWSLYDIVGNVRQWTADWYSDYALEDARDPSGPATGAKRALRGGSWDYDPRQVRASYRGRVEPEYRNYNIGFRCVGE